MPSLANLREPSSWDEFYFQDHMRADALHWLTEDKLPNLIFISGRPGVGKTAWAKLFIKSLLCLNRKPGDFQPCNDCAICNHDPRDAGAASNIIWVQAGKEERMADQVNLALEEANSTPYGYRDFADYKVIVFDEVQTLATIQLQKLLYFPDLGDRMTANRVVFIAITMNEEKVDPVIREALRSRGAYLRMRKVSQAQVVEYLAKYCPDAPAESLRLIAKFSKGNLREANNRLEDCIRRDPSLNHFSVSLQLEFMDSTARKKLWELLEACHAQNVRGYAVFREFWTEHVEPRVDSHVLIQQMVEDVQHSMDFGATQMQHIALTLMFQYFTSPSPLRVEQVMRLLMGFKIINPKIFDHCPPSTIDQFVPTLNEGN